MTDLPDEEDLPVEELDEPGPDDELDEHDGVWDPDSDTYTEGDG